MSHCIILYFHILWGALKNACCKEDTRKFQKLCIGFYYFIENRYPYLQAKIVRVQHIENRFRNYFMMC